MHTQTGAHKVSERKHVVRVAVARLIPVREGTGLSIPFTIRMFRVENARCTGAHDHRNAVCTIPLLGFGRCHHKPVLLQSQPGKTVVTAIKRFQAVPQRKIFQSIDFADVRFQRRILKIAGPKAGSAGQESLPHGVETPTVRGDQGIGG